MPGRRFGERRPVGVEGGEPEVDCGRLPGKRNGGGQMVVEADVFADGHDELTVILLHRREGVADWHETPMKPLGNDRWQATFDVPELGRYRYTLMGWIDRFGTWRRDLTRRIAAEQDMA